MQEKLLLEKDKIVNPIYLFTNIHFIDKGIKR